MAYVAITKTLTQTVGNNIELLRRAELSSVASPSDLLGKISGDPTIVGLVTDKLWEPMADVRDRLSEYDRKIHVRLNVTRPGSDLEDGTRVPELNLSHTINDMVAPCFHKSVPSYHHSDQPQVHLLHTDSPLFEQYFEARTNHTEAVQRWDKVQKQVLDFLSSCKSVNEAIKLWPDVVRYLPKDAVDKVNQKTEKAAKEESGALAALRALDMDAVNASTVLARMAGARV